MKLNVRIMVAASLLAASATSSAATTLVHAYDYVDYEVPKVEGYTTTGRLQLLTQDELPIKLVYTGRITYNDEGRPISVSGAAGDFGTAGLYISGAGITTSWLDRAPNGALFQTRLESTMGISGYHADIQTGQVQHIDVYERLSFSALGSNRAATLESMRLDLANRQFVADFRIRTGGEYEDLGTQAFWTFDQISGVTSVLAEQGSQDPVASLQNAGFEVISSADGHTVLSGQTEISGIRLTSAGLSFLETALGLTPDSAIYTALLAANADPEGWGRMSYSTSVSFTLLKPLTPPVPEPSTALFALLGLGLMGTALRARRHRHPMR